MNLQRLIQRIKKLPVAPGDVGLEDALASLEVRPSQHLFDWVEKELEVIESKLLYNPFFEPQDNMLDHGDFHVFNTLAGKPVRLSFRSEFKNKVTHIFITGQTGYGKSVCLARLVKGAALNCHSIILTSNKSLTELDDLKDHEIVRLSDLRINLWKTPKGVNQEVADQIINHLLAKSYGLQFAEYEIAEAVAGSRKRNANPSLPGVLEYLKRANTSKFSRRNNYRDSAILVLQNLLNATGEVFKGEEMDFREMISGHTIFILDVLPEHASLFKNWVFDECYMLSMSDEELDMPVVVGLDEAQGMGEWNLAEKILQLRHSRVHLIANYQNCSTAPIQLMGNSDCRISFACSEKDAFVFSKSCNLNNEQMKNLTTLEPGNCVCFLPQSGWKNSFRGVIPKPVFREISDTEIKAQSEAFRKRLSRMPAEEPDIWVPEMDKGEKRFLDDVMNQEHEFSPLMQRVERAGVNQGDKYKSILKKLQGQGLVTVWKMALGRGAPWTFLEPTKKALDLHGHTWKKTRGAFLARAATHYMMRKLETFKDWTVIKEGTLEDGGKQIDLLCRDSENRAVTIEIANSPGHEVTNALYCLGFEEVRKHLVVCIDTEVVKTVKKLFKNHKQLFEDSRIEIVTLAQARNKNKEI